MLVNSDSIQVKDISVVFVFAKTKPVSEDLVESFTRIETTANHVFSEF
jgi:hypothetical protein